MLAHLDEVEHLHPHPAGVAWEVVVLGVLVTLVTAMVVVAMRRRAGAVRPSVTSVHRPGADEQWGLGDE